MAEIHTLRDAPLPLTNYEAEQALLGGLIARNGSIFEIATIIRPDMFADALHGRIFAAMERIIIAGGRADVLTLKTEFENDPAIPGNSKYLPRIAASVVSLLNLPDYAQAIRDLWMRRTMIEQADRMKDSLADFDKSSDELIASWMGSMTKIASEGASSIRTKREVAEAMVEDMSRPIRVTSTGIEGLDRIMGGGLIAGKFYGISARKKVGKTVLLGTISYNLDRAKERHLVIQMEMSPTEMVQRDAARELVINPMGYLRSPTHDLKRRTADFAGAQGDTTLYEHCPGATLDDIRRVLGMAVVRYGIKGAFVDYLQLIEGKAKNETEELHHRRCAQYLANFARKHGIWIVVACQLNQEGNTRGGEGIRLACDMLLAVHRPVGSRTAWVEMQDSRYTPYENLGTETIPGLWFHTNGPFFDENPPPAQNDEEEVLI